MNDLTRRGRNGSDSYYFLRTSLVSRWDSAAKERLPGLLLAVDWQNVLDLAGKEFIKPLLFQSLQGVPGIPESVNKELKNAYLENAKRNLFISFSVGKAIEEMEAVGIRALVLKGPALAETVYANIALRPYRDIDLLVKRSDIPQAIQCLLDLGYQMPAVEEHPEMTLDYENEILLIKYGRPRVVMELHWALLNSPYYQRKLDQDWFFASRVPLDFGKVKTHMLAPEANLLYLSAHLILHHWGDELLWLNDIAELLLTSGDDLDWDLVLKKAQQCSLTIPLQRTIKELGDNWAIQLPPGVLTRLFAIPLSEKERQVVEMLTSADRAVHLRFWRDIVSMAGFKNRLTFIIKNLVPSREYMVHRYHDEVSWPWPFLYFYRWGIGVRSIIRRR